MEKILAVYLKRIIDQLEAAIAEVDDKLPECVERMPVSIITDEKEALCMMPIINLLGELEGDLGMLIPEYPPRFKI